MHKDEMKEMMKKKMMASREAYRRGQEGNKSKAMTEKKGESSYGGGDKKPSGIKIIKETMMIKKPKAMDADKYIKKHPLFGPLMGR